MDHTPILLERGGIYRVAFSGTRHTLKGSHYAVVVSDSMFNEHLSTVIVVPFSTGARPASFRPEATINGMRTRALTDQLTVVNKTHIHERISNIAGSTTMDAIDDQLRAVLVLESSEVDDWR